ncbi:Fc.00g015220.m01.CDS01 [Cosmosporella sp. VM-42]
MDRDSGTPPPYTEIPQTPRDKPAPGESGESQHHLFPGNVPSPNVGATKLGDATSFDEFRRLSLSPGPSPCLSPVPMGALPALSRDAQFDPNTSRLKKFWLANKPSILVALSQFFGALMNLSARLLEFEGDGMHPVQVLLLRQSMTSVCCMLYMWYMQTPHFPFGRKDIRWLLLARGCSGFFGIYGIWYSMMYLPLADATVISFLAPGVAGFICWFLLKEPFTRIEQLATFIALMGVVLIAQPASLFSKSEHDDDTSATPPETGLPGADHEATAEERLVAVGVALLGVFGAAGAFTALRAIGKRAHPLISVNYFGVISTIISISALAIAPAIEFDQPALRWVTPSAAKQWLLLLPLGILGFIMQYLLTAGLGSDKSNKANAMVYTHMLFAASFDRWVFGHRMGLMSAMGCTLILGSAIGVVLTKKAPAPKTADDVERQGNMVGESEGSPMLLNANAGGAAEELRLETRNI